MKHIEFINFLVEYVIACDDALKTVEWWNIVHRIRIYRRKRAAKLLYYSFRRM